MRTSLFRGRRATAGLVLLGCVVALGACGRQGDPSAPGADADAAWLEATLPFMEEMARRLEDPAVRETVARRLEAGEEGWALAPLGLDPARLEAWEARLRPLLAQARARRPEDLPAPGGMGSRQLAARLRTGPVPRPPSAKETRLLCAVEAYLSDLTWCGKHTVGLSFALCALGAYVSYLHHLSAGCGG